MSTQFAFQFSLIAFATFAFRAVLVGDDFENALRVGILVLTLFFGIGFAVGDWARRLTEESVEREIANAMAEQAAELSNNDSVNLAETT